MRLSQILRSLALSIHVNGQIEETPELVPFDKSQLSLSSFFEQFTEEDWFKVWKISKAKKNGELYYTGEWTVEESDTDVIGFTNDKALKLKTPSAHHAISAELPQVFDNTNNTLVLQYEVKLDNGLTCGGAYVKLLNANENYDHFNDATPFQVLFGPAHCGPTNRVHLIIRHRDKKSGVIQEKFLDVPPPMRLTDLSTLYTLIIKPTQEFQIRINGEIVKSGSLIGEFTFKPSFSPPKLIEDPDSTKPEDWVDEEYILDPNQATKPDDWDEEAPYLIDDPQAIKPETWDEDEPLYIPNPDSQKPPEWKEEEDGIWIAPLIFNTKCLSHGCGPFKTTEKIVNPQYKGKWTQPYIENPDYIGLWTPDKIPNPDYYEELTPSNLEPIGAIGFELWSVDNDILFNNIYLGHSIKESELIGNETFINKSVWEQRNKEESARLRAEKLRRASSFNKLIPLKEQGETWSQYIDKVGIIIGDYVALLVYDMVQDPSKVLSERYMELVYVSTFLVTMGVFGFYFWGFVIDLMEGILGTDSSNTGQVEELAQRGDVEEEKVEIADEFRSTGANIINDSEAVSAGAAKRRP
ncbi:hypothetical protein WICPIJ_003859 [Wickerhamomyces pijperi]|uniref:Calnexin n=1 Tax=Wickerhamomyces pijperi TaxID=599730 RepID=A0A9P8Q716_WICPI|nr:hypothetical protein WICPIJ_003859 [Wickerhamomyces pijperi]